MARVVRRIGSEYTNPKVDDPKESHRGQLLASRYRSKAHSTTLLDMTTFHTRSQHLQARLQAPRIHTSLHQQNKLLTAKDEPSTSKPIAIPVQYETFDGLNCASVKLVIKAVR
jgi:hypothetical protein